MGPCVGGRTRLCRFSLRRHAVLNHSLELVEVDHSVAYTVNKIARGSNNETKIKRRFLGPRHSRNVQTLWKSVRGSKCATDAQKPIRQNVGKPQEALKTSRRPKMNQTEHYYVAQHRQTTEGGGTDGWRGPLIEHAFSILYSFHWVLLSSKSGANVAKLYSKFLWLT